MWPGFQSIYTAKVAKERTTLPETKPKLRFLNHGTHGEGFRDRALKRVDFPGSGSILSSRKASNPKTS